MKLKIKITAILLIFCLSLSFVSCDFIEELVPDGLLPDDSDSYSEIQDTVSVSVLSGENFTVTTPNPLRVRRGESATFGIEIAEGYELDSIVTEGAVFEEGTLTLDNVSFPTSIEITLKKRSENVDVVDPDDECTEHKDENRDKKCDVCKESYIAPCTEHTDTDKNKECDYCSATYIAPCSDHSDLDKNKKCDYCGAAYIGPCTEHTDTDRNKKCDYCDATYIGPCTEHTDTDRNKKCDYCDAAYIAPCSTHLDTDKSKTCDYCGAAYIGSCTEHTDTDKNKACDYCSVAYIAPCTDHTDTDRNKKCDYCGAPYIAPCTDHTDTDRNKKCDYCDTAYIGPCTDHTDTDRNKKCDYCDTPYIAPCNDHIDTDRSKTCDYCGTAYIGPCTEHTDVDRNKLCDYCGANYVFCAQHTDLNRDKSCDYCEAYYIAPCSDHTDLDRSKTCDYCGTTYIAPCSDHTDTDRNKKCDYCDIPYIAPCNDHVDTDRSKTCDYCGTAYIAPCTEHTDVDRNKKCDYCDAAYVAPCYDHTDIDRNKACDYCEAYYIAPCQDHTDTDRNKACDYCRAHYIAPCTEHTDTDRNKKCDYCDAAYIAPCTDHTDTDKNKKCDYCDTAYIGPCTEHTDTDRSAKCDYCDAAVDPKYCTSHKDDNNDLICDTDWCYQRYYVEALQPRPAEGYHFICWTLNDSCENGGEILSENATGNVKLMVGEVAVANYVDNQHYVILYRTNGGKVTESGKDYYYQTFSNAQLYSPNTLHQNGTFSRDGHVLLRYTENPDGSGEYTTLGGKYPVNENGFCELWLMWGKTTTRGFTYELYENENGETAALIKKYTGTDKNVIIPETVTAVATGSYKYKVDKILSGAFSSTAIETLVLPSTIRIIEDKAFENCTYLRELTVHDNFHSVKDAAFSGCTALSKIYLNAGRLPRYVGGTETMNAYKYDKIRYATENNIKKIIVMSGSSSLYGFSAEQMEKALNGEYAVINHGSNAGVSIHLYMEAYLRFYREGDIIIQAPETTSGTQLGDGGMTYLTFRGCEVMPDIFSYVDMRNYTGFFDGLTVFNQEKRNDGKEYSYETISTSINKYTDLASLDDRFTYTSTTTSMNPYNASAITDVRAKRMNALYDKIHATGAKVYMSFAPINKNACKASSKTEATHTAFVNKIKSTLHVTVISNPADYMLDQKYFYNSDYHPGATGRQMRTEMLTRDLLAQLEKEKSSPS